MTEGVVYVVDDDDAVRASLSALFAAAGMAVSAFADARTFLRDYRPQRPAALVLDVRMPGLSGLELQSALASREADLPIVFLTGHGDIPMSVRAMRGGAVDFLTKPADGHALVELVSRVLAQAAERHAVRTSLTGRERAVLALVAGGASTKVIAASLGISARTVDVHRAHLLRKLGAHSAVELAEAARRLRLVSEPGTAAADT